MPAETRKRRAIGIVRVSNTRNRVDDFASPHTQRQRIEDACERDDLVLVSCVPELDVRGGTPLNKRETMRKAVEAVESGEADVIVAAYFDRLFRSLKVQTEILERVEAAGGNVLALDSGKVTNGSAGEWLSAQMRGVVSEFLVRTTRERVHDAHVRAVREGRLPYPNVPPGLRRGDDGRLHPEPETVPVMVKAYEMRAAGAAIPAVRAFLAEHGIKRTDHGVQSLLSSRIYLGEIHFGALQNLAAHEPIIDRDLWQAVQRVRIPRGRKAKSERLLARLGVLRCATCNARMSVASAGTPTTPYVVYRCPPASDCPQHVTIGADTAEGVVADAVRHALADAEGRASAETGAAQAAQTLETAQADLDAALRAFVAFKDEPAARERLTELRDARDAATAAVDQLGGLRSRSVVVNADRDWGRLTLDERRALIRAVVARATVRPAHGVVGADRIAVELVGE